MRGIVKATAAKAMKGSERAAEVAFRYGAAGDAATGKLHMGDHEINDHFLVSRGFGTEQPMVTDDHDEQSPEERSDELISADAEQESSNDDG